MTRYNSVLVRQNLQDQGLIPRTGGWTASPDLIAAGRQPVIDPQGAFSSASSYGSYPTQPIVFDAPNYYYLRGKNLGTAATTAEARIFHAPSSLFLYPAQWLNSPMATSDGTRVIAIPSIPPNAIGVTTDPFAWIAPPASEPYSLVGFISTPAVPFESQKPSATLTSMDDLAAWIGTTGGTTWHNIRFHPARAAAFSQSTTYPASTTPSRVQFAITAIDCPIGSSIGFQCGTPLPNGVVVCLPPVTVDKPGRFGVVIEYDIPAGWTSSITYSYFSNGCLPGERFNLSVSAAIKETAKGGHAFSPYVRLASEVYPGHEAVDAEQLVHTGKVVTGPMPVSYIIPVGSVSTIIQW